MGVSVCVEFFHFLILKDGVITQTNTQVTHKLLIVGHDISISNSMQSAVYFNAWKSIDVDFGDHGKSAPKQNLYACMPQSSI